MQEGERVAVVGSCPPLVDALARAGAEVWQCQRAAELADGGRRAVDHLMYPDLRAVPDLLRPDVIRHAVRPGGTLLIGTQHRRGRPTGAAAHSTRSLHAALVRCGVGRIDIFAVRQSLSNPRAIVPVDDRILRWYVTTGFLPLSRLESILASGLSVVRPGRVALALFPALMALGEVVGDP
jgi:hypothetical protein